MTLNVRTAVNESRNIPEKWKSIITSIGKYLFYDRRTTLLSFWEGLMMMLLLLLMMIMGVLLLLLL